MSAFREKIAEAVAKQPVDGAESIYGLLQAMDAKLDTIITQTAE